MAKARNFLAPFAAALVFLLCSLLVLPYPGIQNDEAFFAGPLYSAQASYFHADIAGKQIPLMVMSYSGALKTWLYAPLWNWLCDPSVWSLRLPPVICGLLTLLLTWSLVRSLAGNRAAVITAILLGTDTCFQLTNTFDWGPVALQHVLLMGGLAGIVHWLQHPRRFWPLAIAAFCWGLGLWDKAVLIWPLTGLFLATLAVYPRQLLHHLRNRRTALSVLFLLLGAAPLLWFNLDRAAATVTANTHFSLEHAAQKARVLVTTADGAALFDYIVRGDYTKEVREPSGFLEHAAVSISETLHHPHHNASFFALLLASIAAIRYRLARFFLLAGIFTWLQMFITQDAGRGAHHVILLWPFPAIVMGLVFARVRLPGMPVVVMLLACGNLSTYSEYLAEFIRYGATVTWTDAVYPLAKAVATKDTEEVEVVDWGVLTTLQVLLDGSIPVNVVEPDTLPKQLSSPKHLFVQHTTGNEIIPGVNAKLRENAANLGYQASVVRTVRDRNGREIFELIRFEKR